MATATPPPAALPATGLNPWPCRRCGTSVVVAPPPRSLWVPLAAVLTLLLVILGVRTPDAGVAWVLTALALVLSIKLTLMRSAHEAWRCPRCRLTQRARLAPATAPAPLVAVPTYNNHGTIADVISRALAATALPLLVVDDGSTDGTSETARTAIAAAPTRAAVVRHARNLGKGAALRTALLQAQARGFSHLICLDGDGQHHPEDLPELVAALRLDPTAIHVGARDLSAANVQGASRFGRAFSNFWLRVQTGRRLADSQSGFRVYPVASTLSLPTRSRRFAWEVEILTLAGRAGIPLKSLPIRVHYPPPAERVSHFDKLWDNVRISWVNTRLLAALPLWVLGWPARLSRETPPSPVERDWSGQSRGGALGHLIFLWLVRAFGPTPAYWMLHPVALYFVFASQRTVAPAQAFLDLVLGPPRSRWARFRREFAHVRAFSESILDRGITLARGTDDFVWESSGEEHLAQPGGKLLLSAHMGNYEIGGARLAKGDLDLHVVMLDLEARAIKRVYARMGGDRPLPAIIAVNRSEFPALRILEALRAGGAVAMLGDRVTDGHWVWCEFFGRRAAFPVNAFMIAAAARVPVCLTFGFRVARRRYRFVMEPPRPVALPRVGRDRALREHAQWYASRVEHYARQYPLQWFNFYDFFATPAPSPSWEQPWAPERPA